MSHPSSPIISMKRKQRVWAEVYPEHSLLDILEQLAPLASERGCLKRLRKMVSTQFGWSPRTTFLTILGSGKDAKIALADSSVGPVSVAPKNWAEGSTPYVSGIGELKKIAKVDADGAYLWFSAELPPEHFILMRFTATNPAQEAELLNAAEVLVADVVLRDMAVAS